MVIKKGLTAIEVQVPVGDCVGVVNIREIGLGGEGGVACKQHRGLLAPAILSVQLSGKCCTV